MSSIEYPTCLNCRGKGCNQCQGTGEYFLCPSCQDGAKRPTQVVVTDSAEYCYQCGRDAKP